VTAVVEPRANVSEVELKHAVELIDEQSKKPFQISTSPVEWRPPPAFRCSVAKVRDPFTIDMRATDEVPDEALRPDPIAADHPKALIIPWTILRLETFELPERYP
jgi:hypothetical protein